MKYSGLAYLSMSAQDEYTELEQARERLIELLHYQKNRLSYRKCTDMAMELPLAD